MTYITYFVEDENGGEYIKIWMNEKIPYYIENKKETKKYNVIEKKDKIFRICKKCKSKKLLKNYYVNLKRKKTYYRLTCKKCISNNYKKHRKTNKKQKRIMKNH